MAIKVKATKRGYGGVPPRVRDADEVFSVPDDQAKASWYKPLEGKAADTPESGQTEAELEIDALRAKCRIKGVDFDGRWGADKLREALGEAR